MNSLMDKIKSDILKEIKLFVKKELEAQQYNPQQLLSGHSGHSVPSGHYKEQNNALGTENATQNHINHVLPADKTTDIILQELQLPLETPKETAFGDFAFPCFSLAKVLKKSPNIIAQELVKSLPLVKHITKMEIKGAYINFFINKDFLNQKILTKIAKEKGKYGLLKQKKRIMIEFCSPNTNKPLHLGHVRNCVLGDALCTLLEMNGNKVIRSCLVNDRGVHICKSMLAYQKWGNNQKPDMKGDHFVGKYYVIFCKEAEKNPELEKEAQEMLQEWEKGNKKVLAIWKKMNSWVNKGFQESYKKMDVRFDKFYYESDIYKFGREIVLQGVKKNIFKEENGAIYADLTEFNLPKKILMRADGTSLYVTQDIYLAIEKVKKNKLHSSYYVVGSEQNLHFQQLFGILRQLGYKWAEKAKHISYGMVYLPEGKMKSREGRVIDADDFVDEIISLAKYEITLRHKELSQKAVEKRARQIALGSLRFYLLKTDLTKDIYYDPKESISFEGETAPYVQYTIARIHSVIKKYDELQKSMAKHITNKNKKMKTIKGKKLDILSKIFKLKIDYSLYGEQETKLIKLMVLYSKVVLDSVEQLKPSLLSRYILDLAQACNEYYHAVSILNSAPNQMAARLYLMACAKEVLVNGLSLLHIESPEEM